LFEYSIQLSSQNQFRLFGGALSTPAMPEEIVLDTLGAEANCTSLTDDGEVIVGTEPAVFFWKDEDKRQCLAFEGKKTLVQWFRGNLIVVTEHPAPAPDPRQGSNEEQPHNIYELNIYDIQNKLIAFQNKKFSEIKFVAFEWGSVFVFTSEKKHETKKPDDDRFGGERSAGDKLDGDDAEKKSVMKTFMYELVEKDTQSKLESLFKKSLFPIAITLAQNNQLDSAAVASIITRFAEHLYNKGDYDGAIQQFIRTIGQLEPSYVIVKFLDAQRINNLTNYLEELHKKGLANSDHTTLLLNCYTKLKDANKLEYFLSKEHGGNFDVETAIKVCRTSGFFDHALHLAQAYHEHDWYLKIQLEDLQHYDTALQYISSLRHDQAELYLKKYGKVLVSHIPEETTDQLVTMCTTDPVQPEPEPAVSSASSESVSTAASALPAAEPLPPELTGSDSDKDLPPVVQLDLGSLEPISVSTSQLASAAMEKAAEYRDKAANFFSSMMTIGKNNAGDQKNKADDEDDNASQPAAETAALAALSASSSAPAPAPVQESRDAFFDELDFLKPVRFERSKPEDFIHIYVGLPRWLRTFLERVIAKTENISRINYDTLLELYLRGQEDESNKETDEEKEERLEKARQLLESRTIQYDQHHALVLCQRYGFDAGVLILLEKLDMSYEIIQAHMDHHEYNRIIQDCQKFGKQNPNIWIQALTFFATLENENDDPQYTLHIQEILENIEKLSLMSPLLVLQILSQKSSMPLDVVKSYISTALENERKVLLENEKAIASSREETAKLRADIQELTTAPKVFQIRKCTFCGHDLTTPTVHFLCMHSFHQHCLGENDHECPLCASANHQVLEAKRNLEEKANKHSQFMKELESSKDGFSVIAKYCGNSIFGCLNDDPSEMAQNDLSSSTLPLAVPYDA